MALVAAAAVAAGAALQSATGFGFSIVAAPLVFAVVEPEEAVGLLIVLGSLVNVLTLATERRLLGKTSGEACPDLLLYGATEHKAVPESLAHWNRLLGLDLELRALPVGAKLEVSRAASAGPQVAVN